VAEDSIAGGRLLGTRAVQEGIDEVGKQLKALAEQIKGLAALTKTSVVGGSVASGSVPMSYGHANGGGGTFGGAQFPGAGAPSPFTAGLATGNPSSAFPQNTQAAPNTPNGGGGSFAGSIPGRAMSGGAASFSALANYGNRIMPDQVGFNYVERYASRGAAVEGSLTKQLFTNQFYGQSAEDRQQGVMSYVSQSGNAIGTRQATTQLGQLGAMSVANPTMPYADLVKGQMAATSTRGYYGLAQWGVSTLGANGRTMGPTSIGKQLSRTMGINPNATWNNKQINATFDDQNSAVNSNFRMLVGTGAMTQETADMQMADMRARAVASSNGMSGSVYQQTMKAYLGNDAGTEAHDNAQAALREAGVTDTSLQTLQHQEGAQQNRTVNQTDAFAAGLEDASDAVAKFSQAITNFLESTGLDKALGYGSGASSVLAGAAGGTMGALGGIASSLGGGAIAKAAMSRLGLGGAATAVRGGAAALAGGVTVAGAGTAALVAGTTATAGKALSNLPSMMNTKSLSDNLSYLYGDFYENATPAQKKYLDSMRGGVVEAMSADIHAANTDSVWDTITSKQHTDETQVVYDALQAGMPGTGGGGPDTAGRTSGKRKGHASGKPQVSGDAIAKYALTFVGKVPYVWGGTTPNGWDCSGFALYVFNHFGVSLPRLAGDQARGGKPVKKGDIRPGDLLFFELGSQSATDNGSRADHVGIAIGGGKMVNAANTNDDTCVMPIWDTFTHARRYVGAGSGSYTGGNGKGGEEEQENGDSGSGSGGALGASSEGAAVAAALGASAGAGVSGASGSNATRARGGGGSSGPSAAALKGNQLLSTLSKAGFKGDNLRTAWAVAMAESGGRPTAHAVDSDDNSYGLFQINMIGSLGPARREQWNLKSNNELYDPDLNAKIAFQMSQGGKNWSPWGAYTSGAYKDFYNKVPGYSKGAWEISGDQTATVHDGEMIIPRDQAETIRSVLMRENVGGLNGNRGGGAGGLIMVFQPGSIKFGSAGSGSDAKRFAKQFVDAVADDHRVKDLQKGR
jgi:cell wall-associated NlpC family hydrolase